MAYTKTSWNNGRSPAISATNLNHIERGIEDAHNLIDAISARYGTPLTASLVSEMTETDKIYVYVGSETGYTTGNWYYYDLTNEAWVSGGVYNSVAVQTDTTLSQSGMAADAKKTGDEINDLKSQITNGVPYAVKLALDNILQNVTFKNDDGYSADLSTVHAWATDVNVTSISAVYTQSGTVYDTDSLDDLRSDLVVTASYDNETTAEVSSYTLSGTLTAGTSTITVAYGGKTTTFNVTVTHQSEYTMYDYLYSTVAASTSGEASSTALKTKVYDNLNGLIIDTYIMPLDTISSATCFLGGQSGTGSANQVSFFTRTDTQRVSCFSHGTALAIEGVSSIAVNSKTHVRLNPGNSSPSSLTIGNQTVTEAWTNTNTLNAPLGLFGIFNTTNNMHYRKAQIGVGTLRVYDLSETLLSEYVPCVRNSDNVIGIYDTVTQTFLTTSDTQYATVGNSNCRYAVGNWED